MNFAAEQSSGAANQRRSRSWGSRGFRSKTKSAVILADQDYDQRDQSLAPSPTAAQPHSVHIQSGPGQPTSSSFFPISTGVSSTPGRTLTGLSSTSLQGLLRENSAATPLMATRKPINETDAKNPERNAEASLLERNVAGEERIAALTSDEDSAPPTSTPSMSRRRRSHRKVSARTSVVADNYEEISAPASRVTIPSSYTVAQAPAPEELLINMKSDQPLLSAPPQILSSPISSIPLEGDWTQLASFTHRGVVVEEDKDMPMSLTPPLSCSTRSSTYVLPSAPFPHHHHMLDAPCIMLSTDSEDGYGLNFPVKMPDTEQCFPSHQDIFPESPFDMPFQENMSTSDDDEEHGPYHYSSDSSWITNNSSVLCFLSIYS